MNRLIFYLVIAVFIVSCRDNYELPLRSNDVSLLVVEGVLTVGQGATTITLSRTLKINEVANFKPENGAKVTVEARNGGTFTLSETNNGNYNHPQLPLVFGQEYRLRILTNDNKEYLSNYVVAKQTPQIDAITWRKEDNAMRISVNTKDPTNSTRYYKWDFDEAWEIRSNYTANYRWISGTTIVESPNYNSQCWKFGKSNTISIGSSAQLESDVINEAPIHYILPGSERLGVRYSILVKQQSLTKEAYEYFKIMKTNTESLGSIFDAQPSETKGNIKCISNPDEDVIGFLTASSFAEKRIFITQQEAGWVYRQLCESVEVPNSPESISRWVPGFLPFDSKEGLSGIEVYVMAQAPCVDCTARGGLLNRPSYW
jgi:hypothetical protein